MADVKEVELYNRGSRTYHLSNKVKLLPGKSAKVSGKEAALLLGMKDIIDASKLSPARADENKKLREENARLKAENDELNADPDVQAAKEKAKAKKKGGK